ncbi:PPOX class F420-dependent oxidoreductase [Dictyobacter arantiisoli]|uniref:Pyridoxamine 5'-phosphate oxidase N-terminal domain-containing protein n=1 Tax=Dictyobacter arantiisoli TaxID=2014874 RepID=A0A5A5TIB1_9CHLR|nr:PPOX class F420-dependent oxidoreductase [Dictyobacter arantiisoli]GCF11137.1 hypothetical protein KDI_47010 [Dictyobacter arantiisoli]
MALNSTFTPAARALYRAQYGNLITFRKNGNAVSTPIWFGDHDGIIYIETGGTSGKVKRIRHTDRVTLAPCTASGKDTGEQVEGHAYIVTNTAELFIAKGALHRKYSWKRQLYYGLMELVRIIRRQPEEPHAIIAVKLA